MKNIMAVFSIFIFFSLAGSVQAAYTQANITTLIQAILANNMPQARVVLCMHPDIIEDTIKEVRHGSYTVNDIEAVAKWLNTHRKDSNTAGCSHPAQYLDRDELPRGSHQYH